MTLTLNKAFLENPFTNSTWQLLTLSVLPSAPWPTAPLAPVCFSSAHAGVRQQGAPTGPSGRSPLQSRWAPEWGWASAQGRSLCRGWMVASRRLVMALVMAPWTRGPRPTRGPAAGGRWVWGLRGGRCACPFPGQCILWGSPARGWQESLCGSCRTPLRGTSAPGGPRGRWVGWRRTLKPWSCGGLRGSSAEQPAAANCSTSLTCPMVCGEQRLHEKPGGIQTFHTFC